MVCKRNFWSSGRPVPNSQAHILAWAFPIRQWISKLLLITYQLTHIHSCSCILLYICAYFCIFWYMVLFCDRCIHLKNWLRWTQKSANDWKFSAKRLATDRNSLKLEAANILPVLEIDNAELCGWIFHFDSNSIFYKLMSGITIFLPILGSKIYMLQ